MIVGMGERKLRELGYTIIFVFATLGLTLDLVFRYGGAKAKGTKLYNHFRLRDSRVNFELGSTCP